MAGSSSSGGVYSPFTGFIFIFNLIVGAGALTIPHAFAHVGMVYGAIALSILAMTSYATATFMIEAIAGVNALKKRRQEERSSQDSESVVFADNGDLCQFGDSDTATSEFMPLMVPTEVHVPAESHAFYLLSTN